MESTSASYLFLTSQYGLEEEDVNAVRLRRVCITIKIEEVEDVLLALHLLHDLVNVDLSKLLILIHCIHDSRSLYTKSVVLLKIITWGIFNLLRGKSPRCLES